jgi:hypothetical protein
MCHGNNFKQIRTILIHKADQMLIAAEYPNFSSIYGLICTKDVAN